MGSDYSLASGLGCVAVKVTQIEWVKYFVQKFVIIAVGIETRCQWEADWNECECGVTEMKSSTYFLTIEWRFDYLMCLGPEGI